MRTASSIGGGEGTTSMPWLGWQASAKVSSGMHHHCGFLQQHSTRNELEHGFMAVSIRNQAKWTGGPCHLMMQWDRIRLLLVH